MTIYGFWKRSKGEQEFLMEIPIPPWRVKTLLEQFKYQNPKKHNPEEWLLFLRHSGFPAKLIRVQYEMLF